MSTDFDLNGIQSESISSEQFDNNLPSVNTTPEEKGMEYANYDLADQENEQNMATSPEKKNKPMKLQLDSPKYAKIIETVEQMFVTNLPLDEIIKRTGVSTRQAMKILIALKEEGRITEYKPPYTIVPAKTPIAKIFSKFAAKFKDAMLVPNADGSVTVRPIQPE